MKIRLREQTPPLLIWVKNYDEQRQDLVFYSSCEVREPSEQ